MSKMTREAKAAREVEVKKPVVNFMGGTSYEINPIDNSFFNFWRTTIL